jgi:hypothetical protein
VERVGHVGHHLHLAVRVVRARDVSIGVACVGVDDLYVARYRRRGRVRTRGYMGVYQWVVHTENVTLAVLGTRGREECARPERRETVCEARRVRRRRPLVQRAGDRAEPTLWNRRVERLTRGASLERRVQRVRRSVGERERREEEEGEEKHGNDNERGGLEKCRGQ